MRHWFICLFFLAYISCVVFAVTCIIEALFLQETLKMAAWDADAMVQDTLELKEQTLSRIHDLFVAADSSGDGLISVDEFQEIFSIPEVKGIMELLELHTEEVVSLFNLLD